MAIDKGKENCEIVSQCMRGIEREREREKVEMVDSRFETMIKKVEKEARNEESSGHIYCVAIFTI